MGDQGRTTSTMGTSTRQRLAALIQQARGSQDGVSGGGGMVGRPSSGAKSVGGYQGGLGGTWSRSATGRMAPPAGRPSGLGQPMNPILGRPSAGGAPGPDVYQRPVAVQRQQPGYDSFLDRRIRPASLGARNGWDTLKSSDKYKDGVGFGSSNRSRVERRNAQDQQQRTTSRLPTMQRARPNSAGPSFEYEVAGCTMGREQYNTNGSQQYNTNGSQQYNQLDGAWGGQQQRPASAVPAAHPALRAAGAGVEEVRASVDSFSFGMGPAQQQPGRQQQQQGPLGSPQYQMQQQQGPQGAPQYQQPQQQALQQQQQQQGPGMRPPAQMDESLTVAALGVLEDAIRDALRTQCSVTEGSKDKLLKMFKSVDDGSGDVSTSEFCAVTAQLGVRMNEGQAAALFKRYGFPNGVMPFAKWADTFVGQPNRQLGQDIAVRKGPFKPGQSARFNGKIIYEECRTPVFTPSNWDPQLAVRSADLPDVRLTLEFVYGYAGVASTSQNLFWNCEGNAVYFMAGLGVVYNPPPKHTQRFFLGHNDDIKSCTVCPAAVRLGEQEYPAYSLVATGQVSSHESGPYICIWDSRAASSRGTRGFSVAGAESAANSGNLLPGQQQLVRLDFDKNARGLIALGFSPCGTMLAAVSTDNQHTVTVWDWRSGVMLGEGKGAMGEPPQVYGLLWNPYQVTHNVPPQFVTFGKKHVKTWTLTNGNWVGTQMSSSKLPLQNAISAAWLLPTGSRAESLLVTGMSDGQLYVWKGTNAIKAVAAHKPGPKVIQPDGHPDYSGVRGMSMEAEGRVLCTGGADGVVLQFDVSDGNLVEGRFAGAPINLNPVHGATDKPPVIKDLDAHPGTGQLLVGTEASQIIMVNPLTNAAGATTWQQQTVLYGHSSDAYGAAWHPGKPRVCATVCDGSRIYIWDTERRDLLRTCTVGFSTRAVTISKQAYGAGGSWHVALGGAKGHLKVLDEETLQPLWEGRDSQQGISELDYSPNGRYLAAATYDQWVDIYNVEKGYQRTARCVGHSSTVRCLDWSNDSSVIQSNCAAREILYWDARTGKKMPVVQKDTDWAGWTCLYGFPVMGIWPDFADGTDVNSVDRSNSEKYLVSADDKGLLKLFNYPVVVGSAPHRSYRGHSSHVMCVRWSPDDAYVNSIGGKDWAMLQFRVVPVADAPQGHTAASPQAQAAFLPRH